MKTSRNVLVSGLVAPPGPRLGGPNYGSTFAFLLICIVLKKVAKNKNFKKRIGIWTFGASGTSSWWVKLWKLSRH